MPNNGWIKLYRAMLENPIMTSGDSYLCQLWVYILLSVNVKKKIFIFNNKEITLLPGQGIFGLNQIVKECTIYKNENTANFKKFKTIYYRKLKILKMLGNLKLQPTNKFTVITVRNWSSYQSSETPVKLQRNSSETPVLTNKNDKNDKNDKKTHVGGAIAPTPSITKTSLFLNAFNKEFGTSYQLTDGKRIKLKARMQTYTFDQILLAMQNMASDPFYRGKNDRGWRADPDFLLRNDEQIDKFLNLNRGSIKTTNKPLPDYLLSILREN